MCLKTLDKTTPTKGIGWKLASKKDKSWYAGLPNTGAGQVRISKYKYTTDPIDITLNHQYSNRYPKYRSGFHIFTNEEDAKKLLQEFLLDFPSKYQNVTVVKVRYRNAVASGDTTWYCLDVLQIHTVVARDIKIIEEVI